MQIDTFSMENKITFIHRLTANSCGNSLPIKISLLLKKMNILDMYNILDIS